MSNQDVYQQVTDRMIAQLAKGTVPWRQPWRACAAGGRPRSISTGDPYHGINRLLLAVEAMDKGYTSPWWGTYDAIARQSGMEQRANPRNGHKYWVSPDGTPRGVRRGETGTKIVFSRTVRKTEIDPATGEKTERPVRLLHMWSVFNAGQAEQLPGQYHPGPADEPVAEIRDAQEVIDRYLQHGGPRLRHVNGDRACYSPERDEITLPGRPQFTTPEAYYSTAFHELGHSTGHPGRLNREGIAEFDHFGSGRYSKEELIAELTDAMLMAETGIQTDHEFEQSAAYIAGWMKALENDPGLLPRAAGAAQRAADLITQPERPADKEAGPRTGLEAA